MVFWVMNDNGKVIARSTIVPLKPGDYNVKDNQQRMNELVDTTIHQSIGDYQNALNEDYTDTPDVGNNNIQDNLSSVSISRGTRQMTMISKRLQRIQTALMLMTPVVI